VPILLYFLLPLMLYSSHCILDKQLEVALLKTEGASSKRLGYPYIIAFNNKSEAVKVRSGLPSIFLNWRVVDCKSESYCIQLTQALIGNGITNLDLGAFQLNYKFHPGKLSTFFNYEKSRDKACKFMYSLSKQEGWSWKSIAMYHSRTQSHNEKYQTILKKHFKQN
jgi:hypothetical protein